MNIKQFNNVYAYAKNHNIYNDEWLNTAGYLWVDMTKKQGNKMIELALKQNCKNGTDARGDYIELNNGLKIYKAI